MYLLVVEIFAWFFMWYLAVFSKVVVPFIISIEIMAFWPLTSMLSVEQDFKNYFY